MPILAENKRARYEYDILDTYEAGLALTGPEVKSVRAGKMKLSGAHVAVRHDAAWLIGAHIPAYPKAGRSGEVDPYRSRRLLLHRRELKHLAGKGEQKGLTFVPISAYTKGSKIKLSFALARGKKRYEKREAIKKRDIERELRRTLKG
ncbi:SsrA-binding protein [Parcubacteria bacterium SG8_24]|nr:MAG: SsrA-binding protein [Parcubacteria bacterium SG8_24]